MILLEPRVLVIDVPGGCDALCEGAGAGAEPSRGAPVDAAIKDELNLIRAAEIEVFTDHLFEKQAAMHGAIERLGQRELGLEDRDVVAEAGFSIRGGERVRKKVQPLAKQAVDLLWR